MLATLFSLVSLSLALDCSRMGLGFLDRTFELKNSTSTPPTQTDFTFYFSPCQPAKNKQCADDDKFCVVESIDGKVTAVKPVGSQGAGAKEHAYTSSDGHGIGDDDGEGGRFRQPDFHIMYEGAQWGEQQLFGQMLGYCEESESEAEAFYLGFSGDPIILFYHPGFCFDKKPNNPGNGNRNEGGGHPFLKFVFYLVLFAGLSFGVKLLVQNAQNRGMLPVGVDFADLVKDLPYLIRDALRKLTGMFTSRSGYSAL